MAAFTFAVMVTVEVPVPPEINVTGVAVAVTSAGVPSVELTAVAKEMVPAKLLEFNASVAVPLEPVVMEIVGVLTVSV